MKRRTIILFYLLIFALFLTAFSCNGKKEECLRFYVSPSGSDLGTGSEAQPFLTPARAVDEVRSKFPLASDAEIIFQEGVYYTGGLLFDRDFAPGEYCVRFIGQGKTVFSAGRDIPLADFSPADNALLAAEAAGQVVCVNLAEYGIKEYPSITEVGFSNEYGIPSYEFFCMGQPLTLARYPDESYLKALGAGTGAVTSVLSDVSKDKLLSWSEQGGGYMRGYFYHDWADDTLRIDRIDAENGGILSDSGTSYGVRKNARYYVFNYLSELDAEGEWYLDRESGILYIWLLAEAAGSVSMTLGTEPILSINHTGNLHFEHIVFEGSRGNLAELSEADNVTFKGCTFRNAGVSGISCQNSQKILLFESEFYGLGLKAIELEGGDRKTLVPSGNVVSDCSFTATGRNVSSMECISIGGVGNTFTHNDIFNLPHTAVRFSGNDNIISYNNIGNVCYDTTDSGAIYIGRNYTFGGNRIEYNYIHDMEAHITGTLGASEALLSTAAIYLDDLASGITVQNNILVGGGKGVFLGGGKNNTIINNVFLDNVFSIYADNRGETWESYHVENNILQRRLFDDKLDIRNSSLWLTRFPYLAELIAQYDSGDTAGIYAPSGNVIKNNIVCGASMQFIMDSVIRHGDCRTSEIMDRYELFVNPDGGNYTFREEWSHAKFNKIPFGEIGRA